MYKDLKFALDKIFLFMIFVSITFFIIELKFDVGKEIIYAIEGIDTTILTGYYMFFMHGLFKTKQKLEYCKKHWIMMLFLVAPFVPFASLAKMIRVERIFAISLNTIWHLLDELELL